MSSSKHVLLHAPDLSRKIAIRSQLLVTVGIPTFNRPEGLCRTLDCIVNQTYRSLEIIVSDNCSNDPKVGDVLNEFQSDDRVKIVRQPTNLGSFANFKFVLREAKGVYFMWAADDDEWELDFIEKCMLNMEQHSGVFCSMKVMYRKSGEVSLHKARPLGSGTYQQAASFIENLNSSMFYSLHRREDILWWADPRQSPFDWTDCHIALKNILHGDGYALLTDDFLYTLGIDGEKYEFKPVNPGKGRMFEYYPFLWKSLQLIAASKKISFCQRLSLTLTFGLSIIKLFEKYERTRKFYLPLMFLLNLCRFSIFLSFRVRDAIRKSVIAMKLK